MKVRYDVFEATSNYGTTEHDKKPAMSTGNGLKTHPRPHISLTETAVLKNLCPKNNEETTRGSPAHLETGLRPRRLSIKVFEKIYYQF